MTKIPYMQKVDKDTFHDVLFNFLQETCERGTYIFKEGETSSGLFIVKSGIIEVTVNIEGSQLAIERLYRGSVINHNAFLIGDICDVSGHCIDTLTIFYMTNEQIQKIRMNHPDLGLEIDKVKLGAEVKTIPYIVDYIMGNSVMAVRRGAELEAKRKRLTAQLKNLVLFFLARIKQQRNQASFKEVLSNVIKSKKAAIQQERKKKLTATTRDPAGEGEDHVAATDGLTKNQAAIVIDEVNALKEKYNKNNDTLMVIEKQLTYILAQRGISYTAKKGEHGDTPRF